LQKDLVIKEYENKIRELLSERTPIAVTPQRSPEIEKE